MLAKWSDSSPEERQAEFRNRLSSGRSYSMINRQPAYPPSTAIPTIGGLRAPPMGNPMMVNRTIGMQPINMPSSILTPAVPHPSIAISRLPLPTAPTVANIPVTSSVPILPPVPTVPTSSLVAAAPIVINVPPVVIHNKSDDSNANNNTTAHVNNNQSEITPLNSTLSPPVVIPAPPTIAEQ